MIRARATILFDFDGVLIRGDSFASFVRTRLTKSIPRLAFAAPALGFLLVRSTRRIGARHCVRVALLGLDARRYEEAIDLFAMQLHERNGHVIAQGVVRAQQHLAAGDRVVVVTGCEAGLARRLLDRMGLRDVELIASRLREGRIGMHTKLHNFGAEKCRQLQLAGIVPRWQRAYSDSAADLPMLELAEQPVLINANEALRTRVTRSLGREVENETWS
jgi:phosphatidylglycerophosphatase C